MPDKDFDNLFKDKLMDAEVEPSADLWANIASQLEPKKKRSLPIMWMAAASVLVAVSVMLVTKDKQKVYLKGSEGELAAVSLTDEMRKSAIDTAEMNTAAVQEAAPASQVATRTPLKRELVAAKSSSVDAAQKNSFIAMQPTDKKEHLPIKKAAVIPLDVIPIEESAAAQNTETVFAALPQKSEYAEELIDGGDNKKGIRNMGDLINYVVERVDKREQKLIKFNTDDDDNSSIIGLNIGFLKLNKKNK